MSRGTDAFEVAVSFVIGKSQDLLSDSKTLSQRSRDQIAHAIQELGKILIPASLESHKRKEVDDQQRETLARLLCFARVAEDMADKYLVTATKRQRAKKGLRIFLALHHSMSLRTTATNFRRKVNALSRDLAKIPEIYPLRVGAPTGGVGLCGVHGDSTIFRVESERFAGRDELVGELVARLLGSGKYADSELRVISVVGEEAIGKTALVRRAYEKLDVRHHFDCRVWARASPGSDARSLWISVVKQTMSLKQELRDLERMAEQQLCEMLFEALMDVRYLIVLDDLQEVELMDKLIVPFSNSRNGSRVLITTRNNSLPMLTDPWAFHLVLPRLTEEERDEFMKVMSLTKPSLADDSKLANLEAEILSRCKDLPVGILLLRGLASSTKANNQRLVLTRVANDSSLAGIMSTSFHELPYWLKPCILYFSLFPKEYEIPTRRLFGLWRAEGLLSSPPDTQVPRDRADICFRELVSRNMIHVVRRRWDGSPKTCRVPNIMHDFLSKMATDIGFCEVYNKKTTGFTSRHIIQRGLMTVQMNGTSAERNQTRHDIRYLRSYASFDVQKQGKRAQGLDDLLEPLVLKGECSLMRVLDLEGVYKPMLPGKLGHVLPNLRYMGLRWTILDSLPESIGNLLCLETLDLKHTNLTEVPSSIWKLKNLQHLYMNEVCFDKSIHHNVPTEICLNNLQTLWGLYMATNSLMLGVLAKLTGLRKLGLTCHAPIVKEVTKRISSLVMLRKLRLRSRNIFGQHSDLNLSDMSGMQSLSNLHLLGTLPSQGLSVLPQNLKVLTLSMSGLEQDPMAVLGGMTSLTILRLFAGSCTGAKMCCSLMTFPRLRVLKLWKLGQLKEWHLEEGAMPQLEELEIRQCDELELIESLHHVKTLKEINLIKVKRELSERVQGGTGPQTLVKISS